MSAATVYDWVNIVRRARLQPHTKLVAFLLASYANPDGSEVYAGIARLTVQTGLSYRQVQRELQQLRQAELITLTKRQGQRKGWHATYDLTLPANLLDLVDVPTPAEEANAIDAVAEQNRARYRQHYQKTKRHPDGVRNADQTPDADVDQTPTPTRSPAKTKPLPIPNTNPPINHPYAPAPNASETGGGTAPEPAADGTTHLPLPVQEQLAALRADLAAARSRSQQQRGLGDITNSLTKRHRVIILHGDGRAYVHGTAADHQLAAELLTAAEAS